MVTAITLQFQWGLRIAGILWGKHPVGNCFRVSRVSRLRSWRRSLRRRWEWSRRSTSWFNKTRSKRLRVLTPKQIRILKSHRPESHNHRRRRNSGVGVHNSYYKLVQTQARALPNIKIKIAEHKILANLRRVTVGLIGGVPGQTLSKNRRNQKLEMPLTRKQLICCKRKRIDTRPSS